MLSKYPEEFSDLVATYDATRVKTYGQGDEVLRNQMLLEELQQSLTQCPTVSDASVDRDPRPDTTAMFVGPVRRELVDHFP